MKRFLPLFLAATGTAHAADFEKDIRPLLRERCEECHGAKKQKGELRLDAKVFAFKGGHDGPVIVPGDVAKSALVKRITSTDDERMPPKGDALTTVQIAAVKSWIEVGAVWPENDADRAAAVDKRLQHRAVQPMRTEFPTAASIDSFIRAKLVEKGLAMSPEADRRTLIRRLRFDLHGLPPAPERVEQFVKDRDPRAYKKLVDELLASPHACLFEHMGNEYGSDTTRTIATGTMQKNYENVPLYTAVVLDGFKLIHYLAYTSGEEFYDLKNDPDELKNLIADPAHAERIATLRTEMKAELTRTEAGFASELEEKKAR